MTAHTPGPWKVVTPPDLSGDPHELSIKAGIVPIARISRAATIDLPEREANARLIAAAPDLLEALERIIRANDSGDTNAELADAYAQARRAITKTVTF